MNSENWIPVEKMPKDNGTYIVQNAHSGHVAPLIDGVIHNNIGTKWDWDFGEKITHFKYMPDPSIPR